MDFVSVSKDSFVIPKKILNIEYLINNQNTITLPIIQNEVSTFNLYGFTLELRLNLNNPVKGIYTTLMEAFPEASNILNKTNICYGEYIFNNEIIYCIAWIYKYYYNYNVVIFLNNSDNLMAFNKNYIKDPNYFLLDNVIIDCSLEKLEQIVLPSGSKIPNIILFGDTDCAFNDITIKRINTQMKKILKNLMISWSWNMSKKLKGYEN